MQTKSERKIIPSTIFIIILTNIFILCIYEIVSIPLSYEIYIKQNKTLYENQVSSINREISDMIEDKASSVISVLSDDHIDQLSSAGKDIKEKPVYNELVNALSRIQSSDKSFDCVWFYSKLFEYSVISDGSVFTSPEKIAKYSPWYSTMVFNTSSGKKDTWISPVNTGGNDKNVISIISSVMNRDSNIIGYIGIDIPLNNLQNELTSINIPKNLYLYIVDSNNTLVYEPTSSVEYSGMLADNNDASVRDAKMYSDSRQTYFERCKTETFNGYYIKSFEPQTKWNIVLFIDTASADNEFFTFTIKNAVLLFSIIIVINILSGLIIQRLFIGMNDIPNAIYHIKKGDYGYRINSKSKNEIGSLANSVDNLAEFLNDKIGTLENSAYKDALTGIPNRQKLEKFMQEYIDSSIEEPVRFSVVCINIDNMKWYNDSFGHDFGDAILKLFAHKLENVAEKYGICGRIENDTFAMIVKYNESDEVSIAIQKLRANFINKISIVGNDIYLKFKIGVASFPSDCKSPKALLNAAVCAVNYAIKNNISEVTYYNDNISKSAHKHILMSKMIGSAIETGEFYLQYQPIIASDGEFVGIEVFSRWYNSALGNVQPNKFFPVAEEGGYIIPLSDWILYSACAFHKKICEISGKNDLILSMNISHAQLKQSSFADTLKGKLGIINIAPSLLQFEISENTLCELRERSSNVINDIASLGIRIAFDHFGTGFSSLSNIRHFNVSAIKLDRSVIQEVPDTMEAEILKTSCDFCHTFGIAVIATGVENSQHLKNIRPYDVDLLQGFYISVPLSESDMIEFAHRYAHKKFVLPEYDSMPDSDYN